MKKTFLILVCLFITSCSSLDTHKKSSDVLSSNDDLLSSSEMFSSSSSSQKNRPFSIDKLIDYQKIDHIEIFEDIDEQTPTIIEKTRVQNFYNNVLKDLDLLIDNGDKVKSIYDGFNGNYDRINIFMNNTDEYIIYVDKKIKRFYITDLVNSISYAGYNCIVNYENIGHTFESILEENNIKIEDISSVSWSQFSNNSLSHFIDFYQESRTDIVSIWYSINELIDYRFAGIKYNLDYDNTYKNIFIHSTDEYRFSFRINENMYFKIYEYNDFLLLKFNGMSEEYPWYYYLKDKSISTKGMPDITLLSSSDLLKILLDNKLLGSINLFNDCSSGLSYYENTMFCVKELFKRKDGLSFLLNEFLYNDSYSDEDKEFLEFLLFYPGNYNKLTDEEKELVKDYDPLTVHYPSYLHLSCSID